MRAVDAIMECLKAEGVEHVFGIPGGANLPTYDALYDAGITTSSAATSRGWARGGGLRQGLWTGRRSCARHRWDRGAIASSLRSPTP